MIKITTKGFTGARPLLQEFTTNLPQVLGSKPLDEYLADVASNMQQDAPVDTGYLVNNIQSYRTSSTSGAVTSWAPYSQAAEERSRRPNFFGGNTFQSADIGGNLMGQASMQYLQILINKYQNLP
jgi:hypothetical protein